MSMFESAHAGHLAADVEIAHDAGYARGHRPGAPVAPGVGGRHIVDSFNEKIGSHLSRWSPLFSGPFNDSGYLRSLLGNAYIALPIVAAVLGVLSIFNTGGLAVPPSLTLTLSLMMIGVLDAFSGLVGFSVFALGVILSGHFFSLHPLTASEGSQGILYAFTGLFSVALLWFIAPQLAAKMRPIVIVGEEKGVARLHLIIADLLVLPFLTILILGSMPALAPSLTGAFKQGLEVSIQEHLTTIKVFVAVTMFIRVLVELLIHRQFAPVEPVYPSARHPYVERGLKIGSNVFAFVLIYEVMGLMWQTFAVWVAYLLTEKITMLGERFLKPSSIYRFVPRNLFKILVILIFSQYAMQVLNGRFVAGTDILGYLAIALAVVTAVFALLEGANRAVEASAHAEESRATWWTRTAGFVVVLTLFLFSQDRVHLFEAKPYAEPNGISLSFTGNTYIADTGNNRVIRIGVDGSRSTLGVNLDHPTSVAPDPSSSKEQVYIANTGRNELLRVTVQAQQALIPARFETRSFAFSDMRQTPLGDHLKDPTAVAVDTKGRVYLCDTGNSRVVMFPANGDSSSQSNFDTDLEDPRGVFTDVFGNVWVVDAGTKKIWKYTVDETGHAVSRTEFIPDVDENGHQIEFDDPTSVAVDLGQNVFVADAGHHKIYQFQANGRYVAVEGEFEEPMSLAVNLSGHAYVADARTSEIQVITPLYTPRRIAAAPTEPGSAVALVDNTTAYVVSGKAGTLEKLTDKGAKIIARGFREPRGVAVNALGEIYVSDAGSGKIYRVEEATGKKTVIAKGLTGVGALSADGYGGLFAVQEEFGNLLTVTRDGIVKLLVGGLDHPTDCIQDAYGYIDVTLAGHKKSDGKVIRFAPGQQVQIVHDNLERPVGISADANGNLFYIEEGTDRVWEYMGLLGLQIVSERGVTTRGNPLALASDGDGNVYLLQDHPNRVYKFVLSYHATPM